MKTGFEMQDILQRKSAEDSEFRSQLIANPKEVINQEFGIDVPENMDIHVHESSLQDIHIALPPANIMTEEQLEAVSAGLCCC